MESWTALCQLLGLDEDALRRRVLSASDFAFSAVCRFYSAVAPGLFSSSSPPSAISHAVQSSARPALSEVLCSEGAVSDAGSQVTLAGSDAQRSAPPREGQHALSGQSTGALEDSDALEGVACLSEEEGGEQRCAGAEVEFVGGLIDTDREGVEVVTECEEGVTASLDVGCQWEGDSWSREVGCQVEEVGIQSGEMGTEGEERPTTADMETQWEGDLCVGSGADSGADAEPEAVVAIGDAASDQSSRQAEASEGGSSDLELRQSARDAQESLEEECMQEEQSDPVAHLKTQLFTASSLVDELIEMLEGRSGPLKGVDALIVAHVRSQQRSWAESAHLKPQPRVQQPTPPLSSDGFLCCSPDASVGSTLYSPAESVSYGPAECASDGLGESVSDGPGESVPDGPGESVSDGPSDSVSDGPSKSVSDGHAESVSDGRAESVSDGRAESVSDGRAESLSDGRAESLSDGPAESASDGRAECASDGPAESVADGPAEFPSYSPLGSPRSPFDFPTEAWLDLPTKGWDEEKTEVAGSQDSCDWADIEESSLRGDQFKQPAFSEDSTGWEDLNESPQWGAQPREPAPTVKKAPCRQESFQTPLRTPVNRPTQQRGRGNSYYAQKTSGYVNCQHSSGPVRDQRFTEYHTRRGNERRGGAFSGHEQVKERSMSMQGHQARKNVPRPSAGKRDARPDFEQQEGQSLLRAELKYAQVEEPIVEASHFIYEVRQLCGATAY